jgi:hypothetical protein
MLGRVETAEDDFGLSELKFLVHPSVVNGEKEDHGKDNQQEERLKTIHKHRNRKE